METAEEYRAACYDVEQGSDEWFDLRSGKVGSQRIWQIAKTIRDGSWAATRKNCLAEIVIERLTGTTAPSFISAEMQWGLDHEEEAAAAYAFQTNSKVQRIGYAPHPTIKMAGASPDRLVGIRGALEIKCPNSATHMQTLLGAPIDWEYITQCQWEMACTGRLWVDWLSYDPRMPPQLRLVRRRVNRAPDAIAELEKITVDFLREVDVREAEMRKLMG